MINPRKLLLPTIFLALFGSGVVWVAISTIKDFYVQSNAIRLDPYGLIEFEKTHKANVSKAKEDIRLVFVGDSRAADWSRLSIVDVETLNTGIYSQTSEQIAGRYSQHVSPLKPDIVAVQFCINDLKTIPLFPKARDRIVARCLANIKRVLELAHEDNTTVILSTVFPAGKPPLTKRFIWSNEIDMTVIEVNKEIRSLASKNVCIFDAALLLRDPQDKKAAIAYYRDQLHLNTDGYKYLNSHLVTVLRNILSNHSCEELE